MTQGSKTLTVDVKRVIAGSPAKVYAAWLDPKQPCNPWSYGETVAYEAKVGKVFCTIMVNAGAHFGRILKLAKGKQMQFTWVSSSTRGLESTVIVQFKKHVAGTLVTLHHSGLPDDAAGRGHAGGWGHFLGMLETHFTGKKGN